MRSTDDIPGVDIPRCRPAYYLALLDFASSMPVDLNTPSSCAAAAVEGRGYIGEYEKGVRPSRVDALFANVDPVRSTAL